MRSFNVHQKAGSIIDSLSVHTLDLFSVLNEFVDVDDAHRVDNP